MQFLNPRTITTDIAILCILSLVPLLWFRSDNTIIVGWEIQQMLFSITPTEDLYKNFYMWKERYNGGFDNSWALFFLFPNFILAIPLWLGATLPTAQKVYLIILFGLSGFSMYWMVNVLFPDERDKRIACLSASIFYMFSYQIMMYFMQGTFSRVLCYGMLPLFVTFTFNALKSSSIINKYTIALLFLAFPFSALTNHPSQFLIFIYTLIAFVVFFYCGVKKEQRWPFIKAGVFLMLSFILVNLWWILPMGRYIYCYSLPNKAYFDQCWFNLDTVRYYSGPSLFYVFQQKGIAHYFNVGKEAFYHSKMSVYLGVVFPILAYCVLFFRPQNRNIKFFVFLSVVAIFLSKSIYPPFGGVYEWLFLNVPGFSLIRSGVRNWPTLFLLAWAPLIGLFIARIGGLIGRRILNGSEYIKYLIFIVFCCSTFAYSWPLFTGDHLLQKGTLLTRSIMHELPFYYKAADTWLENQADQDNFKIYNFIDDYLIGTGWGFGGEDLTKQIISAPQVSMRRDYSYTDVQSGRKYIERFSNLFGKWAFGNLSKVLGMLSIKYVMVQNDIISWTMPFFNANDYYSSLLRLQEGMYLEKSIGELDFYRNDSYLPRIYGVPRAFVVQGGLGALMPLSLTHFIDNTAFLFNEDLTSSEAQEIGSKIDGTVIYGSNIDRSTLDTSKEIVVFNTEKELYIPRSSDYRLGVIALPDTQRGTKDGFVEDFKDLNRWELKSASARVTEAAREGDSLRLTVALDENKEGYIELNTRVKEGVDVAEYQKIALDLGVEDGASQEIKVELGYDYTAYSDDHIDGWLEVPLKKGGSYPNKEEEITANLYELLSKHFNAPPRPLVYWRIKFMRITLKTVKEAGTESGAKEVSFYLRGIRFFGDSGILVNRPAVPDKVHLNIGDKKVSLSTDRSGTSEIQQLHLEEGRHAVSVGNDTGNQFLLHLESAESKPPSYSEPRISFQRLNPTKYKVYVHAEKPFWLVFNDSFDSGWQAYDRESNVYQHLIVNGFGNGFYIDRTGDYEIILEYGPQKLFILSAFLSVMTMAVVLGCFVLRALSPRRAPGQNATP